MGAGGANVALGGSYSAVFSNPAGLTRIPKEYGWEFQLINVSAGINDNMLDLPDIIDDADESDAQAAETLGEHIGDIYGFEIGITPFSIAKMFDETAFGLGAFVGANTHFAIHQGFGAEGILEANILAVGGAAGAIAHNFNELTIGDYAFNRLSVGVGAKALSYGSLSRTYSAADIANEEFDNIEDEIKEGTSVVFDLGVIYEALPNLSVGISALNIGGVGDESAEIPMTINAGVSYVYRVDDRSFFNQARISADYIDISKEYPDNSYVKRTRIGADLNVWDGWFSTFAIQAGLYQGEWTAGASARFSIFEVAFATYAEELGAYAGQDSDRRYMGSFGINW
jgi:hypothetical protein